MGVGMANRGSGLGCRLFPKAQIAVLINLVAAIRSRWTIPDARILGHSDVAPRRKTDPGELFPWKALAQAGHGLWAEPPAAPGPPLGEGDEGLGVLTLQAALARLGYACPPTGVFDGEVAALLRAFHRHWRP